jgi:hypothetical protein
MCSYGQFFSIVFLLLTLGNAFGPVAEAQMISANGIEIYGDFRTRLEADFASRRADGRQREDRTRVRMRFRLGLEYTANDLFSFGTRLRSGSDDSHQSPHVTVLDFDNNDTGDAEFNLDKWYARAHGKKLWGWIGRNSLPLWKQNEFVWDDDVTAVGVALGFKTKVGEGGSLALNSGYFSPPVGMQDFSGHLGVGQLVLKTGGWTAAGALLAFDANPDDPDAARLLQGNGARDYTLWLGSLQYKFTALGRGLKLGIDLMHNSEDYSTVDPDPNTSVNREQRDGFVLSTKLGDTREKGDWLAAYYYAEVEALAVNASYAQDDWVRWGSAVETRSSGFEGHELRFAYALEENSSLVARLYLVNATTSIEDGSRFRLDFNYTF